VRLMPNEFIEKEELEARVDAIIETWKLPDDPKLREKLLQLSQVYHRPKIPLGERISRWWKSTDDFRYNLTMILVVGSLATGIVGGIVVGIQSVEKRYKYERETGYVYQTTDVFHTADDQDLRVLVQIRAKGEGIPYLSNWRTEAQYKFQVQVLRDYFLSRSLEEIVKEGPEKVSQYLLRRFAKDDRFFREGEYWTDDVQIVINPIAPGVSEHRLAPTD
jgi:hypothetical protein